MDRIKIIRTSTVPLSLNIFCKGLLSELQTQENYDIIAISSPGELLDEIARREGVRTYPVAMERRISPLKDLISLWNLIKIFRMERPDMVHSMTPKAGLLSMIAACIVRVPVRVHTFTGLVFPTSTGLKRKILMLTDRLTCACATHIIPEGKGVMDDLSNYNITKKPMKVLGHGNVRGIDLDYYDPSQPDIQKESSKIRKKGIFTFIYVGRLVKDKGINELIKAFSSVNVLYPKTRLLLVGPYEEDFDPLKTDTLAEINKNDAIEAVGMQADVRPWLAASDAFVFPSYREGFPNVIIEAGAMGLPCIVTDINGSREIIENGKNGIIIPSHDTESINSVMKYIINNEELMSLMKKFARPMIASRYEQGFVRKCLKDFYKEILN